jgi:hypothetical protein
VTASIMTVIRVASSATASALARSPAGSNFATNSRTSAAVISVCPRSTSSMSSWLYWNLACRRYLT